MELIHKYFPELSEQQYEQFAALSPLYTQWNAHINVISRRDLSNLYEKHVLHSLSIAKAVCFPAGSTVMDLGTGGGFPGIPLAILFPEVHFHLVDSIGKKIKVVEAVGDALHLSNLSSAHSRAEDVRRPPFDFIVTRAVAPLKKLCGWSWPHLKTNSGRRQSALICLKGGDLSAEIADSGCRPQLYPVNNYFEEPYFSEKYVLVVNR